VPQLWHDARVSRAAAGWVVALGAALSCVGQGSAVALQRGVLPQWPVLQPGMWKRYAQHCSVLITGSSAVAPFLATQSLWHELLAALAVTEHVLWCCPCCCCCSMAGVALYLTTATQAARLASEHVLAAHLQLPAPAPAPGCPPLLPPGLAQALAHGESQLVPACYVYYLRSTVCDL
jgi:hypothetical protein